MKQQNETNLNDIHEQNWREHANCKGKTNLMFPKDYKDITYIKQARQICAECPVKNFCLNYALQYPTADMHGVWAGLTSRQLLQEQRRRGLTPTKPSIAQMFPK
jgi:WhiB family redox-sensing transcriptional regulator